MAKSRSIHRNVANVAPSRPHALLATGLGTFVLCLTFWSVAHLTDQPVATTSPTESGSELSVPAAKLAVFAVLAVAAGVVAAVPGRKLPQSQRPDSAQDLSELLGVPVLASLFPSERSTPTPTKRPRRLQLITQVVFASEIVICTAFIIVMFACYQQRSLASAFVRHPFNAYTRAINNAITGVGSLMRPTAVDHQPKS
ncbi:MAG: hypothetical protein KDB23_16800 [Planctomycetales bacterium]|nr:hypothetical protein [Planctomycetales bacterium]